MWLARVELFLEMPPYENDVEGGNRVPKKEGLLHGVYPKRSHRVRNDNSSFSSGWSTTYSYREGKGLKTDTIFFSGKYHQRMTG
jgi:hypothetical protein